MFWKCRTTTLLTSPQRRSMRWLWTDFPVIMLPRFIPLTWSIYRATSTFSVPKSDRTRDGWPWAAIAASNNSRTVFALLFVLHCRKTINLLYPSIPPWMTNLHLINLWWPSMCLHQCAERDIQDMLGIHSGEYHGGRGGGLLHSQKIWSARLNMMFINKVKWNFVSAIFVCNHNRDYNRHIHVICITSLIENQIALDSVQSITYQREFGARLYTVLPSHNAYCSS